MSFIATNHLISPLYQLLIWFNTDNHNLSELDCKMVMPFTMKLHFPVKLIISLDGISNEEAFPCKVAYLFPTKWLFFYTRHYTSTKLKNNCVRDILKDLWPIYQVCFKNAS